MSCVRNRLRKEAVTSCNAMPSASVCLWVFVGVGEVVGEGRRSLCKPTFLASHSRKARRE